MYNIKIEKIKNIKGLRFKDYIESKNTWKMVEEHKFDIILHLGACSATTESNADYLIENNYNFTKELYEKTCKKGAKFIYASSASVYGKGHNGFIEEQKSEDPLNLYAFTKLLCDNYFREKLEQSATETQIVGLRFFNVYGNNESHKGKMASVPFHLYQKRGEGVIKVFEGSSTFRRDFIYIEDVLSVIKYFMLESSDSGIYNCGTGVSRSFMELAEICGNILGITEIEQIDFPSGLIGKYQKRTEANILKLRKIGYEKPFISIEEGIQSYYDKLIKE